MVGLIQASFELLEFRLILRVALLLLVAGCSSAQVQKQPEFRQSETQETVQSGPRTEASYPAWFWNTPILEDSLFAVGLSETFARTETSEQHAIANGVESLAKALSVRIKGEYGMLSRRGRPILSGSDMQEEVPSTIHAFVEKHHQVVAKYASPMHTFVLLRLGEKGTAISVSSTASNALPEEPSWMTSLPREPGYIHASGQSNPYYRETESWCAAEENARTSLALTLESKVRGLTKKYREDAGPTLDSTIITVSTDVQLNRAQVVARWKHPEYHTCHVLVRMPFSANTEAITNLVKSILTEESQQEPTQKSQEEIIQETFHQLDRVNNTEEQGDVMP